MPEQEEQEKNREKDMTTVYPSEGNVVELELEVVPFDEDDGGNQTPSIPQEHEIIDDFGNAVIVPVPDWEIYGADSEGYSL